MIELEPYQDLAMVVANPVWQMRENGETL